MSGTAANLASVPAFISSVNTARKSLTQVRTLHTLRSRRCGTALQSGNAQTHRTVGAAVADREIGIDLA